MTDPTKPANPPPEEVLVVGVGRSGTSLLQSMLDAHPFISFLPETHFFRYYVARRRVRKWFEQQSPEYFKKQLEEDDRFLRARIEPEELLKPFLAGKAPLDLGEAYRRLLSTFRAATGSRVVGDKDPRNIDFLNEIRHVMDNAAVIHITRDPRDVVLSRMKTDWSSRRPYWLNALVCAAQYSRGTSHLRKYPEHCRADILYERLIQSPSSELGDLAIFLGLEFAPEMVSNFNQSARRLTDSKEMTWKSNTLGPIQDSNLNKWRGKLSPLQIVIIESICREHFERGRYALSEYRVLRTLVSPFCWITSAAFKLLYAAVVRFDLVRNRHDVVKISA